MAKNDVVRWLHISDFHFTAENSYDRDVVTSALLSSWPELVERFGSPNLIFATGDVAQSGKEGEYKNASRFFDRLLEISHLSKQHLFIIPGNHDVDRKKARGLARTLQQSEIDEYFDPLGYQPHISQKLSSFISWFNKYFDGARSFPINDTCAMYEEISVGEVSVGVLPINTASFCVDDNDSGNLLVGMRCLDNALKSINGTSANADLKVALMHHPTDWLSSAEVANIKFSLRHNFHCVLSGHLHTSNIEAVASTQDSTLLLAAGATYQHPAFPKTAMFASIALQTCE